MINVVFFAALREQLNCSAETLPSNNICSVADVKKALISAHPEWESIFNAGAILCAVNHAMVPETHPVVAHDEVAFFPPVTGG